MTTLLALVDSLVFSGVPSNAAWDLIKVAWSNANKKSWEDLYLDAFEAALQEESVRLRKYAEPGGQISLDRQQLRQLLHRNIGEELSSKSVNALAGDAFVDSLADVLAKNQLLVIGGHRLSNEDYASLVKNLVRNATALFKDSVVRNTDAFQQAMLAAALDNKALLVQTRDFLESSLGTLAIRLEQQSYQISRIQSNTEVTARNTELVLERMTQGFFQGPNQLSILVLDVMPPTDDLPLRPIAFVSRVDLVTELIKELSSNATWLALVGGPGMGKSQLSLEIAEVFNPWWILLRNRNDAKVHLSEQLARWLVELTSDNSHWRLFAAGALSFSQLVELVALSTKDSSLLIIDDLPSPQGHEELYQAIDRICVAFMSSGAKLLTNSQWDLPPSMLFSARAHVLRVPPFNKSEISRLLALAGAPSRFGSDKMAGLVLFGTEGIPSLVVATLRWLSDRDWQLSDDDLLALLQGSPARTMRTHIVERLVNLLEKESKQLIYRLSLLSNAFDRSLAIKIASISPALEYPGECFDKLTSPWLQEMQNDTYRVTPLLKEAGKDNLPNATRCQVYLTAVDQILSRRIINLSDALTIATYYWAADDHARFVAFYVQFLASVRSNELAKYVDNSTLVTEILPPGMAWPEDISRAQAIMFRATQIRICALAGGDPTALDADLQLLMGHGPLDKLEALAIFFADIETAVTLNYLPSAEALNRVFQAFLLLNSWLLDEVVDTSLDQDEESTSPVSRQVEEMVWNVVFRLENSEEVEVFLLHLKRLTDDQRLQLFQASSATETFSLVIDRLWMKESTRPTQARNWSIILQLLDSIRTVADLTDASVLNIVQARARAIILADYLEQFDEAISVLQEASVGNDPNLVILKHYTLGNIYFDAGRLDEAMQHYSSAVAAHTDSFGYYRLLAQKYMVVICGKQGNLREAKSKCITALRFASFNSSGDDLRLYDRLDMLGELAWINWALGYPKKACGAMYGLVTDLTKHGNATEPRYREIYNKAGHALGWFVPLASSGQAPQMTSDGLPYAPIEAGFMGQIRIPLQNYQGHSEFSGALLMSQVGLFAETSSLDRLAWKALDHANSILSRDDNWYLYVSSNPDMAPLAARFGPFDDAIRLGLQTIRAFTVSRDLMKSGTSYRYQADDVLERWKSLSDAEKSQAERQLTYLVFGPGFVKHLEAGLNATSMKGELNRSKVVFQHYHDDLMEPEFWDSVLEFLDRLVELYASGSKTIADISVPENEPLLKTILYLTVSGLPTTVLADSLRMQVYSLDYVLQIHHLGKHMHPGLGKFLHRYWLNASMTKGFALRSPQLFRNRLLEVSPNSGVATAVRVLQSACFALKTVLPPEISERFKQADTASRQHSFPTLDLMV